MNSSKNSFEREDEKNHQLKVTFYLILMAILFGLGTLVF